MLIDLTQHATRCSDSSGQAQEYLIARHAAVETKTVLVQICLELGAPSVICSLPMAWTASWRRCLRRCGRSRTRTGEAVTELTDGTLYELRVTVADNGALDRSAAEREISISVALGK